MISVGGKGSFSISTSGGRTGTATSQATTTATAPPTAPTTRQPSVWKRLVSGLASQPVPAPVPALAPASAPVPTSPIRSTAGGGEISILRTKLLQCGYAPDKVMAATTKGIDELRRLSALCDEARQRRASGLIGQERYEIKYELQHACGIPSAEVNQNLDNSAWRESKLAECRAARAAALAVKQSAEADPGAPTEAGGGSTSTWLLLGLGVLVLAGGGTAIYFATRKR